MNEDPCVPRKLLLSVIFCHKSQEFFNCKVIDSLCIRVNFIFHHNPLFVCVYVWGVVTFMRLNITALQMIAVPFESF